MPYIVTQCWYPSTKADEMTEKYLQVLEKYPFDESVGNQIVPVAVTVNISGYESLSIVETDTARTGDALEYAKRFMIEFRNIEELNYEIKAWSTAAEGLARMGIT